MVDKNNLKKFFWLDKGKGELNSLRSKFVNSSVWVIGGHGVSQGLRLVGNLILTRLLFPEVFGVMALINVFLLGVGAISDIGLRGSIVQDPRGDEECFLNTAWTIQILRGVFMWIILCILAKPASSFYEIPQLIHLIPIIGLVPIIQGFGSTSLFTLVRKISLRKTVIRDLISQLVGVLSMVAFSMFWRSVWALVAGAIVRSTVLMVWSHFMIPGYRNRIGFDRQAASAIIHFGKWIFFSTLLTFLGSQGDRLFLGKTLSSNELGVYSIAFYLSQMIVLAFQELSGNVLFPVYTQLANKSANDLRKGMMKIRGILMLLTLPLICILAIWGHLIVGFFYDNRYVEAGWMLQILSIRAVAQVVNITTERVFMACGDSFRHMLLQLSRVILMGIGMYIGNLLAGTRGILIGMTVASFFEYAVMAGLIIRYGAWLPRLDALAFGLSGIMIMLGRYLT